MPTLASLSALTRQQLTLVLGATVVLNLLLWTWLGADLGQLAAQQLRLSTLQRQEQAGVISPGTLRQQAADSEKRLKEITATFLKPFDDRVLQEHVVQAARANGVQLASVGLAGPTPRTLGSGAKYQAAVLSVQARGDLFALLSFISQASQNFYPSSTLEGIKVTASPTGWTAQFDLAALARSQ